MALLAAAIASPETAVHTIINTEIAQIQRRKGHDPVVINFLLDLAGRLLHLQAAIWIFDIKQARCFIGRQCFNSQRLLQNISYPGRIGTFCSFEARSSIVAASIKHLPSLRYLVICSGFILSCNPGFRYRLLFVTVFILKSPNYQTLLRIMRMQKLMRFFAQRLAEKFLVYLRNFRILDEIFASSCLHLPYKWP